MHRRRKECAFEAEVIKTLLGSLEVLNKAMALEMALMGRVGRIDKREKGPNVNVLAPWRCRW